MKFLIFTVMVAVVIAEERDQIVNNEYLDGHKKFTSDVYNELRKKNDNSFVVSPLLVSTILSLAEYGSKGVTSKQLIKGLRLPENKEKLREAITSLMPKLNVNQEYILTSANKIYVKEGFKLNQKFKDFAVDVYKADIENINFEKKESAAENINKWVEDKTLQKIKNLINKDDLNEETRTILVNALYLRADWVTKFAKEGTHKGHFHLHHSAQAEVDFMRTKSHFKYYENHELNAKFLELPYIGHEVTMTIALPNSKDGLVDLESKIAQVLDAPKYKYEIVNVKIPRFKIESTVEFKSILQSLGIINAFEDTAEFYDITEEPLKISKVIQKTVIEVDEEGTTAAAATAVIMELTRSSSLEFRKPKEFIADHPFIFVLQYQSVVLFIGHYTGT